MPRQPGVPRPELKDLTSFITVTKGRAKIDTDNVDVDFCIAVAEMGPLLTTWCLSSIARANAFR
jgi:hypothetical protein